MLGDSLPLCLCSLALAAPRFLGSGEEEETESGREEELVK